MNDDWCQASAGSVTEPQFNNNEEEKVPELELISDANQSVEITEECSRKKVEQENENMTCQDDNGESLAEKVESEPEKPKRVDESEPLILAGPTVDNSVEGTDSVKSEVSLESEISEDKPGKVAARSGNISISEDKSDGGEVSNDTSTKVEVPDDKSKKAEVSNEDKAEESDIPADKCEEVTKDKS